MAKAVCIVCGGKVDLLCDSWLGWERMRGQMAKEAPNLLTTPAWGVPARYRHVHTCDAPLCRVCAVPGGIYFIRLRNRGSFHDSIDYCPGHDLGNRREEISGLQAQAMRKTWRSRFKYGRADSPAALQQDLFTNP